MELEEIKEKLDKLGIPVAYLQFSKPQKLPFMVYFEAGGEVTGADDFNLYRRKNIVVELYTAKKDVKLEHRLENLFRDIDMAKSVDTWLDDEKMFMTAYTFEIVQYIGEE